ncbi:MAG: sn-glycerol-3-phosphate ABC transporter ATP-binding protein UgpC [bacterium]
MAVVKLKNVSKVYDGNIRAVRSANIEIKDGEFVVLVGPSGCGKSTLLRMIAGLEEISEGEIVIDGNLVNNVQPKNRDIAMVFQNYALYPHMTVYENMAFGLKLRKFNKTEIDERVKFAADTLGLTEYLNRKPKALSGGQRQRVAVGRAIVRKPKVFLFDEPLSNLDAKLRVQMRTEISRLHHQLGATMIYVTHDQTEAMTMGDRIVVLKDGVIQQIDTPMNLYSTPANKFVAGFIGSPAMNFIEGTIKEADKPVFISNKETLTIGLTDKIFPRLKEYVNKKITIGIRPENISIDSDSKKEYQSMSVNVDLIEPLGNETLVYFTMDNEQFIARITSGVQLKQSEKAKLCFNIDKIHYFNSETGESLLP